MGADLTNRKDSGLQAAHAPSVQERQPAPDKEHGFNLGRIDFSAPLKALQGLFAPDSDREVAGAVPRIVELDADKSRQMFAAHTTTTPQVSEPSAERNWLQRTWDAALEKGSEVRDGAGRLLIQAGKRCRDALRSVTEMAEDLIDGAREFLKPLTNLIKDARRQLDQTVQRVMQDPLGAARELFGNISEAANKTIAKLTGSAEKSDSLSAAPKLIELVQFPRLSNALPTPPMMLLASTEGVDMVQEMAERYEHHLKRMEEIWGEFTSALEAEEKQAKEKEKLEEEADRRTFLGGDVPELMEKLRDIASAHPDLQRLLLGWVGELEGRGLMPREWICQIAIDGLLASIEAQHPRQRAA